MGLFVSTLFFISCNKDEASAPGTFDCSTVDHTWSGAVENIIDTKCAISGCHVSGVTGNGIFTSYSAVKAKVDNGTFEARTLVNRTMPPSTKPDLDSTTLNQLQCWFDAGALEN